MKTGGFSDKEKIGTLLEQILSAARRPRLTRKTAMRKQYRFVDLSKEEKEYHEMILLEEVDVQAWFAIAFSKIFDEELFVAVQ
jgi:hypothetical protein